MSGLINLRARYYSGAQGRFLTRDTWNGNANSPQSLNRWEYGLDNPVNFTDPSGRFPEFCKAMPTKATYEACVLSYYSVEPLTFTGLGKNIEGYPGCWHGRIDYRARGYLEGIGISPTIGRGGEEVVYDFATMERQTFRYGGLGINDALDASLGVNAYIGMVQGLKSTEHLGDVYLGIAVTYQVGISGGQGISVGSGGSRFWSVTDPRLRGITGYIGGGYSDDLLPIVDLDVSVLAYGAINRPVPYALQGKVDRTRLLNDIRSGKGSQLNLLGNVMLPARTVATIFATLSANTYEALWSENDKY